MRVEPSLRHRRPSAPRGSGLRSSKIQPWLGCVGDGRGSPLTWAASAHSRGWSKMYIRTILKNGLVRIFQDGPEGQPEAALVNIPPPVPSPDLVPSHPCCQRQPHNCALHKKLFCFASAECPRINTDWIILCSSPAQGFCFSLFCSTYTTHLFTVLELFPEALKHLVIHLLWRASHSFDVQLEDPFQEMVDLCIVVIIVSGRGNGKRSGLSTKGDPRFILNKASW